MSAPGAKGKGIYESIYWSVSSLALCSPSWDADSHSLSFISPKSGGCSDLGTRFMEAKPDYLKWHIQTLFRRGIEHDLPEDLRYVSDYYSYLADSIDHNKPEVTADRELIELFESVSLWLHDKLLSYPESVRHQVSDIFRSKDLCQVFAIISSLTEKEFRTMRRERIGRPFPISLFLRWFFPILEDPNLTLAQLFEAKMALRRLAQILKFASSLDVVDYDETLRDFKNNYDPNLVDKNKLLALISLLRVQLSAVQEEDHRDKLSEKLDSLEAELKKPRVRWGIVITGFFILFGFLADLKTLHPTVYVQPLRTVETILSVLHQDGQVQKPALLLIGDHIPETSPSDRDHESKEEILSESHPKECLAKQGNNE